MNPRFFENLLIIGSSPVFHKFASIMIFYIFLSYIVFPMIFYFMIEKTLVSAGNGFVLGSLISIALWYTVGRKMV